MAPFDPPRPPFPAWALVVSLVVHALALFAVRDEPPTPVPVAPQLQASLKPAARPPQASLPSPAVQPAPAPPAQAVKPLRRERPPTPPALPRRPEAPPRWSRAERDEMNRFLADLDRQAKAKPAPSLAERSRAKAREMGREAGTHDGTDMVMLEMREGAPPIERTSLDMYLESLLRRLNQSAGFVQRPTAAGTKKAAVQFRLNPDGSLKAFTVLAAGDQSAEIDYVRAVVNRAVPFPRFPPDIQRSARSLAMNICIAPGSGSESGMGFFRLPGERGC